MRRRVMFVLALALAASGCERPTRYRCDADADCGAGTCDLSTNLCVGKGPPVALTVTAPGDGGKVTSLPAGIDCGAGGTSCKASFAQGSVVALKVTPAKKHRFTGWTGVCGGMEPRCAVELKGATTVGADFVQKVCNSADWCWENPLPQGNNLASVSGTSTSDTWTVGEAGTVLHWNGTSWTGVDSGTTARLRGVWSKGDELWIVGEGGAILRRVGPSLRPQPGPYVDAFYDVSGTAPNNVWIAGNGGVLQWDGAFTQRSAQGSQSIFTAGPSDTWAVADSSVRHWNGSAWSDAMGLPGGFIQWRSPWSPGSGDVWITSPKGYLKCAGLACTQVSTPVAIFDRIYGTSATDIWAVGQIGLTMRWDGSTWNTVSSGTTARLSGVFGQGKTFWAVGESGTIVRWDGLAWSLSSQTAVRSREVRLNGVWGSGPDDVWAAAQRGGVLHWDGASWSSIDVGADDAMYSIWGSRSIDVWMVGNLSKFVHWDGTAWSLVDRGVSADVYLTTVFGIGASDVWVVGDGGTIVRYDGQKWSPESSGVSTRLRGIWASGPGDVWASGDGTILHYQGGKWSKVDPPASLSTAFFGSIAGTGPADVWFVGTNGAAAHWDGTGLSAVPTGTTKELTGVWAASPDAVWITTRNVATEGEGEILRWNGRTWASVFGAPSSSLMWIWGSADSSIWAVGANGAILHYQK